MSNKHTPGPWELCPEIHQSDYGGVQRDGSRALLRQYVRYAGPLGGRICACFQNCLVTSDEELAANARLIAAAPELLETSRNALTFVAYAYSHGIAGAEEAGRAIEAAIAKATGATE